MKEKNIDFINDRIKYISASQVYDSIYKTHLFVEAKINKTTIEQLYIQKYSKDYFTKKQRILMDRGNLFELPIIELANKYFVKTIIPAKKTTYKREYKGFTYITQIDAFLPADRQIVEIKNVSTENDNWKEHLEKYYRFQCILQWWILSAQEEYKDIKKSILIIANYPKDLKKHEIIIDDKEVQMLLAHLHTVNKYIEDGIIPKKPKISSNLKKESYKTIELDKNLPQIKEYLTLKARVKEMNSRINELNFEMKETLKTPNQIYNLEDYQITYSERIRKGNFDYAKFLATIKVDIDIDDFREEPSIIRTLTIKERKI